MPKTLTLPARDEGPHAWLGRLVREDARKRLERGRSRGVTLAALTQGEWEWLHNGWCWARPDRSALTFDQRNDYLDDIVRRHAEKHLAVADQLEATLPEDHPARIEKSRRPRQERLAAIQVAIWAHLVHGFCRIEDDGDDILWWHLIREEFVPFDAEYNLAYVEWQGLFRQIAVSVGHPDNRPYLGPARRHDPSE
ncbi:MAG: hypothetical protein M5U22_01610 [Thermoleophilia bacterium]|nr:hypothetical protein [Thermoleophilia bacterium]